jgi:NADPH-dependent FMN reductase
VSSPKSSPAPSSSDKIARELVTELGDHDVTSTVLRVVDYDIRPGVEKDMGDGDQWPTLRQAILDSDIVVVSTPIWIRPSRTDHPASHSLDGWPADCILWPRASWRRYWTGLTMQ